MIKVLYISHEADEVLGSTLSLVNHLHALRDNVVPLIVLPREGRPADYLRQLGYEVIVVPFKLNVAPERLMWLKFLPRLLWDGWANHRACQALLPLIQQRGIQLIHSNSSVTLLGHQLAAGRLPHIWHLREFQDLDFGLQPFCGWSRLKARILSSSAVIAITQAILDHYIAPADRDPKRHLVINDAVRSLDEISVADRQPYLLFCGKVIPAKGAETALQLFAGVAAAHPELTLQYVGTVDAAYQQLLIGKASEMGIADRIRFAGFQTDIRPYMQHASALLMCSRNEAQGRVTIEAMFYGTPVIAMAAGGTLEIVEHEGNGLLFNTVDEGIAQLSRLLGDSALADGLIRGGHHTASTRFSEEGYRSQLLALYSQIINNR